MCAWNAGLAGNPVRDWEQWWGSVGFILGAGEGQFSLGRSAQVCMGERSKLLGTGGSISRTSLGYEGSMDFIWSAWKCGVCLEQGRKLGSEEASPGTPGREDAVLSS